MTDTRTETALQTYLDEHPGDLVTRLALADLYEETGRYQDAEDQRYLVTIDKCPMKSTGIMMITGWLWWWGNTYPSHCVLPIIPSSWVDADLIKRFPTRCEAEAVLVRYARERGLIERGVIE